MGRKLSFQRVQVKNDGRAGGGRYRLYQCGPEQTDERGQRCCLSCPLRDRCVSSKGGVRTVSRDQHEDLREAMTAKLAGERARRRYARRKWIAETPFAVIKGRLGLRQFLLRGLEKVRTEWLWTCTAFNLSKMTRRIASMRRRLASPAATPA